MTDHAPVRVTLADEDHRGANVYHLELPGRGRDTIRVKPADSSRAVTYVVDVLRPQGWTPLLVGEIRQMEPLSYSEAVGRAVSVLFRQLEWVSSFGEDRARLRA